MADIKVFRDHIIESGVLDPTGVHREFVSGVHGQKIDFDLIEDNDPLYDEWVQVTHDFISENYPKLPEVILGVANGTNRLALDTARKFNGQVLGAVSEKSEDNDKILNLSQAAGKLISFLKPELVVVVEDVGTTGSNSVQVAHKSLVAGAQDVEVVNTWQRRPELEKLDASRIHYRSIINEALATYTPDECRESGFCARGWKFIKRKP